MRPPRCCVLRQHALAALALVSMLAACAGDPTLAQARAAFDRYQDALLAGDAGRLRAALAIESRPAVAQIPFERARGKQRLRVLAAERQDPEVRITVADPNDGGRIGTWVLVREEGELRVDLVASVAFHHTTRRKPGGGSWSITPRELGPAELAAAAAHRSR